jgi:hypothetical protein
VHKQKVDLHPDLFQCENKIDCSINFFDVLNDDIVAEDKDQLLKSKLMFQSFSLLMTLHGVFTCLYTMNIMMIMMLTFMRNQLFVCHQGVFYFSSLMKTPNNLKKIVSLHIIVTKKNMKRIVSWLKVTLFLHVFLHLNY